MSHNPEQCKSENEIFSEIAFFLRKSAKKSFWIVFVGLGENE